MAETKKPKAAGKAKRKTAKPKAAKTAKPKAAATKNRPVARATAAPKRKPPVATRAKATPGRKAGAPSGFDIARIIDHPLVADLLAVGAIAAVAAIADHSVKTRTGEAESGSSKAVKAAGKAAAAAIGKRLMTEVDAIRDVSKAKDFKRGSR